MSADLNNTNVRNPALAAALREMEEKKNRSPWRKRAFIGMSALLCLLVLAGAAWAIKAKMAANEKTRLLASLQDPRQVRQAVESGKVTREEAWDAMEQAREVRENKQLDEYFAFKTQ